MATTRDRLMQLIRDNLEVDGKPIDIPEDLNISLIESGVPSTDLVAFAKLVAQEFNVKFTPEHCVKLNSVRKVADFLDSQSG